MELLDTIKEYFQDCQDEMVTFLEELVMLESGTYQKKGLDDLGLLLAQRLEGLGFSLERFHQEEYGDHFLLKKEGEKDTSLLLLGHRDTVFGEGITKEFPFQVKEGIATGPGVADMKGGLVNICYGMAALKELALSSLGTIYIFLNSDEEVGSPSSQAIISHLASKVHGAFILEPGRPDGSLVTERKGLGTGFLKVKGKAAHAGANPADGVSAIQEIAHQVLSLSSLQDLERDISFNVGTLKGGSRVNVIPEEAWAQLEFRFFKSEDGQEVLKKMREKVEEKLFSESEIQLEAEILRLPIEKTHRSRALFSLVQKAGESLGIPIQEQRTGGISDGNILAEKKVPLVDAMGPLGGKVHSKEEYLKIATLSERAALLVLSILHFFQENT